MRGLAKLLLFSTACMLSSSCISYKIPTSHYYPAEARNHGDAIRIRASKHPAYEFIPRKFEQIKPYDLPRMASWLLLGNDPDGIFGEAYEAPWTSDITYASAFKWTVVRNPLANFKNYVLGTDYLDKHTNFSIFSVDNKRGIRFMEKETEPTVFGTGPNTFQLQMNDFKPYISFKLKLTDTRKFDFGVGWKDRGNFGLKFRPFTRRDKEDY